MKLDKQGKPIRTRKKRREGLYEAQKGRCHRGWGCWRELPLSCLDEAHLTNLGMGASRHGPDPRNENTVLLCRPCHRHQEVLVREHHRLWKAGFADWIDPTPSNSAEFWRILEDGIESEGKEDS